MMFFSIDVINLLYVSPKILILGNKQMFEAPMYLPLQCGCISLLLNPLGNRSHFLFQQPLYLLQSSLHFHWGVSQMASSYPIRLTDTKCLNPYLILSVPISECVSHWQIDSINCNFVNTEICLTDKCLVNLL